MDFKVPANPGTWQTVQNDAFTYNNAGDITAVKDTTDGQSQCYRYDPQHRLTDAFTALDNCVANPTAAAIGTSGKYPYWDSWTFDTAGRRKTDTHRTTTGTTVNTAARTFNYPAVGADQRTIYMLDCAAEVTGCRRILSAKL